MAPGLGNLWVQDLSGTSAGDVWAVGASWLSIGSSGPMLNAGSGQRRHFDGHQWSVTNLPSAPLSVWASSGSVVVGSSDGRVRRFASNLVVQSFGDLSLGRVASVSGSGSALWTVAGNQVFRLTP